MVNACLIEYKKKKKNLIWSNSFICIHYTCFIIIRNLESKNQWFQGVDGRRYYSRGSERCNHREVNKIFIYFFFNYLCAAVFINNYFSHNTSSLTCFPFDIYIYIWDVDILPEIFVQKLHTIENDSTTRKNWFKQLSSSAVWVSDEKNTVYPMISITKALKVQLQFPSTNMCIFRIL